MKTKTKIGLTIGLLSLLAVTGMTQSKYARTSDITLNVSQDTGVPPVTIPNNVGANGALNYQNYTVQKTGYYAIQLKGGDGGTNNDGTGGRGGVVEGVYKLNAGQVISYTLGGVGGHYANGSDNRTAGASYYGTDGVGGRGGDQTGNNVYDRSSREGSGGGGASAVKLGSGGPDLLVAGGGGGGAGGSSSVTLYPIVSPRPGGTGASNTMGATGVIQGTKSPTVPGDRNSDKNGEAATVQASLLYPDNKSEAGGGAGGGYGTQNLGGKAGSRRSSTVTGGGEGGNSYVNPTGYLANSYDLIHNMYASVLTGSTFAQVTGIGGSNADKAGQLRITYLYTDSLQGGSLVVNDIYRD